MSNTGPQFDRDGIPAIIPRVNNQNQERDCATDPNQNPQTLIVEEGNFM